MKGQWIGKYEGANSGQVIINVDDLGDYFQGAAYLLPDGTNQPSLAGFFATKDKSEKIAFRTNLILPIDPRTGTGGNWQELQTLYPGYTIPNWADVTGFFEGNSLLLHAKTNIETEISAKIIKKPTTSESTLEAEIMTWEKYKEHVADLSKDRFLFRGQKKPWKLRTAFHRRGRYDLNRFLSEDIRTLHRHLSAKTRHVFNLNIPDENGAFFNLVQHHGYPSPLLDWTYSPYVAAFFAFRDLSKSKTEERNVRIFVFDQKKWADDWRQLVMLNTAGLHLSVMKFLAIENERMIPQQSVTTVTNIDDIEAYIQSREELNKTKYLTAIDISAKERNKVMKELSFMGITAGSLFPGLDGACEELRERFFDE
jgi:hypothetical protein